MALSLIVFDCDGVILESVDAKTKAFGQVAEPLGAEARDRLLLYHTLHGGVSRREKFAWLYREVFHREITPEEMENCCARFVSHALDNVLNAPLVPGVMDVLELLKGIVRKERIDPADAVMVGDATTDSDAAEAAETLFYGRGPFFENTAYPHGSDLTGLNRWLEEIAGKE